MLIYTFDGSLNGLLTCFYHAHKNNEEPLFMEYSSQLSILGTYFNLETDNNISKKMRDHIISNCGYLCFDAIYKAFLSERENINSNIFSFYKFSLKTKGKSIDMRNNDICFPVIDASNKVSRETHSCLGFVRFKKIDDKLLYAQYSPKSNVTELLMNHFIERNGSYSFIIHDAIRNIYGIYSENKLFVGKYHKTPVVIPNDCDETYGNLWKSYHKAIAIPERKNLSLQRNLMPKFYWKNLTEMQ